jgi:tripartite-type tricarboxylate transporter receptor subunit TctC
MLKILPIFLRADGVLYRVLWTGSGSRAALSDETHTRVQAKQIRLIAVTSLKRVPRYLMCQPSPSPESPDDATSWYMLLTSSKTPSAVVKQFNEETVKALSADDMREMMGCGGVDPLGNTPAEAMAFLKAEIAKWGKVIRTANVTID